MEQPPLMVVVVVFGMVISPVPPITPAVHVCAAPVMVIGAFPASVPPFIVSVGTEIAPALFSVSVPLTMTMLPVLVIEVPMVVVEEHFVAPVMLYVPLTVFVPAYHCTVPGPLMVDAAAKL